MSYYNRALLPIVLGMSTIARADVQMFLVRQGADPNAHVPGVIDITTAAPGELIVLEAYVSADEPGVGIVGAQATMPCRRAFDGGGDLSALPEVAIDTTNPLYLFHGMPEFHAADQGNCPASNPRVATGSLALASVDVTTPRYLGSFTYKLSDAASGEAYVAVLPDPESLLRDGALNGINFDPEGIAVQVQPTRCCVGLLCSSISASACAAFGGEFDANSTCADPCTVEADAQVFLVRQGADPNAHVPGVIDLTTAAPGELVVLEAYVSADEEGVGIAGAQVTMPCLRAFDGGGHLDALPEVVVDTANPLYLFHGVPEFHAVDQGTCPTANPRVAVGSLALAPVDVTAPRYLGSFTYRLSDAASGEAYVAVLPDPESLLRDGALDAITFDAEGIAVQVQPTRCCVGLLCYFVSANACAALGGEFDAESTCEDSCGTCLSDGDCDNGQLCDGYERCLAGRCEFGSPDSCDDGIPCTMDSCDGATDTCVHVADDSFCSDGVYCNGAERCDPDAGGCASAVPVDCDDGLPCTLDYCDEPSERCWNTVTCDDGQPCTLDVCDAASGECLFTESDLYCAERNDCTSLYRCDALYGCLNTGRPCEIGQECGENPDGGFFCVPGNPPVCVPSTVIAVDPPDGTVDAGQPTSIAGGALQGIGSAAHPIRLRLTPTGFRGAGCFTVCETGAFDNMVQTITYEGNGWHSITLAHPVYPGRSVGLWYRTDPNHVVHYSSHPGNVNGDNVTNAQDVLFLIDVLNGVAVAPHGLFSTDIDRSGRATPADILRLIDLLNGADAFIVWNGTSLPSNPGTCP